MVMKSVGEAVYISTANPKCPTPTKTRGWRYSLVIYESKCSHDGERNDGTNEKLDSCTSITSNVGSSKPTATSCSSIITLIFNTSRLMWHHIEYFKRKFKRIWTLAKNKKTLHGGNTQWLSITTSQL